MKRLLAILVFLAITVIITVFLLQGKEKITQVCFISDCFNIELADTPEKIGQGLMFRESLDQNKGMLFIFPKEDIYSFWMKNTLMPLDIIWLDENQEIVFISKNNQPCEIGDCRSVNPEKKAKYVLEINAGLVEKIGLEIGEKMEITKKR